MISLYSGTPGSGKSLHTAKEMRDRAILGKPTICNFEVNVSKYKRAIFEYVPNDLLTPEFLISYSQKWFQNHRFKEGTILIIGDLSILAVFLIMMNLSLLVFLLILRFSLIYNAAPFTSTIFACPFD